MCWRLKRRCNGNRPRRVGAPLQRLSIARMQRPTGPLDSDQNFRLYVPVKLRAFKIAYFIVPRVRRSEFQRQNLSKSFSPEIERTTFRFMQPFPSPFNKICAGDFSEFLFFSQSCVTRHPFVSAVFFSKKGMKFNIPRWCISTLNALIHLFILNWSYEIKYVKKKNWKPRWR